MLDDGSWGFLELGRAIELGDPEVASRKQKVVPKLQGTGWEDNGEGVRPIASQGP